VPSGNEVVVTDGGAAMVSVLDADLLVSATALAVSFTEKVAVTVLGAV